MEIIDIKEQQRGAATAKTQARPAGLNEIPVIDVSGVLPGASAAQLEQVASEIAEACERIGFFYAVNHGIPQQVIDQSFTAAKTFFSLPLEQRMAIRLNQSHRGYMPLYDTTIPGYKANRVHSFELAHDLPPDDPDVMAGKPLHATNVWPASMPDFRETVERYYLACCGFGFELLKAFARSLDLPADFFQQYYLNKPLASMRLLHYPPAIEAGEYGIAPHSDYGIITMLCQGETNGLELFTRDGEWIAATYVPGALVINIGDLMALWTNDRFTSMQHRVVTRAGEERYSIPVFYNPAFDTQIECLPSCASADNPAKYEKEVMGDYLIANFGRVWEVRKTANRPH